MTFRRLRVSIDLFDDEPEFDWLPHFHIGREKNEFWQRYFGFRWYVVMYWFGYELRIVGDA